MKFIKKHFFVCLIILSTACGTITIDYSAEFQAPDDVTVIMQFSVTDELIEELKNDDETLSSDDLITNGWTVEILEDTSENYVLKGTKRFKGDDAQQLLSGAVLDTDNQMFELRMSETDMDNYIEYRIEIPVSSLNDSFTDAQSGDSAANETNSILGDDFEDEMEDLMLEAMQDMISSDISFIVFGEIVSTNAHDQLDNRVSWNYDFKTMMEATDGPYVITQVKKNTGLFGSCK